MTISENPPGTEDVPIEGTQRPLDLRTLFDAGVHFGHPSKRWNPKMASYIFGIRSKAHIIDLAKTVTAIEEAKDFVQQVSTGGGQVLMVGTKKQAQQSVKEESERVGAWYINQRWLGGMLTNFQTIQGRIERLVHLEDAFAKGTIEAQTKRESLSLETEVNRLNKFFGGIKEMDRLPDAIFVIDTEKENIAISESKRLGIPIIAISDTNSDPADADYPIPGNDDSVRSVQLIVSHIADSIDAGKKAFKTKVDEQMAAEAELEAQEAAARAESQKKAAQRVGKSEKIDKDKKEETSTPAVSNQLKNKKEDSKPPGKKSEPAAKDGSDQVSISDMKVSADPKEADPKRKSKSSRSEGRSENNKDDNKGSEESQTDEDQPDTDKGSESSGKEAVKKKVATDSAKKKPSVRKTSKSKEKT